MPLDKGMSHEDMVAELMRGYKKTGKIGATTPRDKKHALEIANAVAYNLEESKEIKKIEKEVTEMKLSELLEALEEIVSAKEEELGIFEIEENPKVKVTLDSGETFETEVDPATSEDDLEKQYKIGTEINVGKEGQERKARIKLATLTKQMGEDYEEEYHTCEWCGEEFPESEMQYEKDMGWLCDTCIRAIESRGEELEFDESFDTEYKKAESTLSKYFTNASDIMRVLDSQSGEWEDLKETLNKIKNLVEDEGYHITETERNNNIVFDKDSNPLINFYIDDDDKVKFSELDLDEVLENPPAVIENPTDVISLDIPLLMRLLEWSKEQAGEDVDLHVLTENLVEAMKDTEFLTMDDYERLVPCEECNGEEKLEECDGSCATTSSDMGADQVLPFGKKNKIKQLKNKKSNRTVKS